MDICREIAISIKQGFSSFSLRQFQGVQGKAKEGPRRSRGGLQGLGGGPPLAVLGPQGLLGLALALPLDPLELPQTSLKNALV